MKKNNYTKVISIDAATKSLAIACLNLFDIEAQKINVVSLVNKLNDSKMTDAEITEIVKQVNAELTPIQIVSLEVVDLIPNEKVSKCSIVTRSSALVKYMHDFTQKLFDKKWLDADTHLIVEYQMGPNRKSGDIQTQLIYHFLQYLPSENIHVIGPSLKNKLLYPKDPNSVHSSHIAKFQTLYTANKSHTKYLFLSWLEAHKQAKYLEKINKKNYADIADAFCQAAAWQLLHASK